MAQLVPARDWAEALGRRALPSFDPTGYGRLVVLAAHPDDETLGAGGCLRLAALAGVRVSLVVATDGEAAYPSLDAEARAALGRARREELTAALRRGGLDGVPVRWLGLPDSGLAERPDRLADALSGPLAGADAYLAPWVDDPHPDHRAVGAAAAAAAPVTAYGWSYPIWMWPWMSPDDASIPWDRAHLVPLSPADRAVKRAALACFTSQSSHPPAGLAPVLDRDTVRLCDRDAELVFREPRRGGAPLERFARLYAGSGTDTGAGAGAATGSEAADPWRAGSWYERRKRAVVLAALPRERYRSGYEPGCGTGELTAALARRCDRLVAHEPVPAAAARARRLLRERPGVEVGEQALPAGVPAGPIDLAVFSEVLYYLDEHTVRATTAATVAALEPGGDLVLVHWRGWPAEAPRDAVATELLVAEHPGLVEVVEHRDEGFRLRVLRRR